MPKIWISSGKDRWEKNWKNVEFEWSAFVEKFRETKRTSETISQYLTMSPDQQGNIKDVGGFVGGVITGGRRKIGSVSARYLLTLDIDFASIAFWEDLTLEFDCEMFLYSTHKHTSASPRYRLIIPLEREVLADEYEAIARKIAGMIDIELFDPTTFQPERLMYWPSTSKDGEYVFKHQKGNWLNPDTILNYYVDWRDSSQWPISEKTKRQIREGLDKQENPTAKGGLIGTFCRCYSISEAIEKFIPEIYEETQYQDRYTYALGSTSAGVVVYDDLFSFSHHSTDPTCGRLCNAFDLVRIHLFGEKDKDMKEGTPASKRPSFLAMGDFMTKDEAIKQAVISERLKTNLEKDFGVLRFMDEKDKENRLEEEWIKKLDMDKKGNILSTINNTVLIMNNDSMFKDNLWYDDLRKCTYIKKDLPWRKVTPLTAEWGEGDDSALRNYLEILYGVTNRNNINDALTIVFQQHVFHPVKEYFSTLQWDKKERVDKLLIDYLGAEDTPYVRSVTRKTLVAAVARIYNPGCKFDHVLTIVGPQGIGKSRLIKKLGGKWFSDTFGNLQNKDAMEQLHGVWIMEIGELAGLKNHEVEVIKLFIAKQEDRFRVAYGRRVESFPRQCIFIGTTNSDEFLKDQTGNRRFWPVKVNKQPYGVSYLSQEDVDQIWAEACMMYLMGEELYLDEDMEQVAREVQETYTEHDDRKEGIINYLETKLPTNWESLDVYQRRDYLRSRDEISEKGTIERETITMPEIWLEHVQGKPQEMTPYNTKWIRNIMNKLPNWESKMINRKPYGHQRGWIKTSKVAKVAKVATE